MADGTKWASLVSYIDSSRMRLLEMCTLAELACKNIVSFEQSRRLTIPIVNSVSKSENERMPRTKKSMSLSSA